MSFDKKDEEGKLIKLNGIKLVVPQSAPIDLTKLFAHVWFKDDSASLHSLTIDEGKLIKMSESHVTVKQNSYQILHFDGSSQQSKQAY